MGKVTTTGILKTFLRWLAHYNLVLLLMTGLTWKMLKEDGISQPLSRWRFQNGRKLMVKKCLGKHVRHSLDNGDIIETNIHGKALPSFLNFLLNLSAKEGIFC